MESSASLEYTRPDGCRMPAIVDLGGEAAVKNA
jgi:hypothetical protein